MLRWDAVDAKVLRDERHYRERQNRVVLTPRRWRQVFTERSARATVAKEPGHRGEHGIAVKTIAQETPDCSANLW
jgi:hypothetical protein